MRRVGSNQQGTSRCSSLPVQARQTSVMVGQHASVPVAPVPTGLLRSQRSADGTQALLVPGPLTGQLWAQIATLKHPQLARTVLVDDGRAGALVSCGPASTINSGSSSFSDSSDVAQWLRSKGVWAGSPQWSVRVVASRSRPPFFVVLPFDLDGVPGWQQLRAQDPEPEAPGPAIPESVAPAPEAPESGIPVPEVPEPGIPVPEVPEPGIPAPEIPVKRLPLHRRARFRFGAIAVVTSLTVGAMLVIWPLRFHASEVVCPDLQEAGALVEELLEGRARALIDRDLEALALVESGDLLARDTALLEQKGDTALGEVEYRALPLSLECDSQGIRVSGEIVAVARKCQECDEQESKRDFQAMLSRPWRIEEFR